MKSKCFKKTLAFMLSAALVFSLPAASSPTAASAAAKSVKLNAASKTLTVGQKDYRLKLKNNTQGWKIKKVTSTKPAVCKPYGKKASSVLLKAKKAGSAKIKVTVARSTKTAEKTKKLVCKVRVVKASEPDTNPVTPEPTVDSITATNQSELNAALTTAINSSEITSVIFKTDAEGKFIIADGDYSGISLTVDAPKADMENSGRFKSVKVLAIKENTWIERAVGNLFDIAAKTARIIIEKSSSVAGMNFTSTGADVKIVIRGEVSDITFQAPDTKAEVSSDAESRIGNVALANEAARTTVNMTVEGTLDKVGLSSSDSNVSVAVGQNGAVENLALASTAENTKVNLSVEGRMGDMTLAANKADVDVNVSGSVNSIAVSGSLSVNVSGTTEQKVPVKVTSSATVTASTAVDVQTSADATITLEKNAENSTITVVSTSATVKVENNTGTTIKATTADNKTVTVPASKDATIKPSGSNNTGTSSGSSGGYIPSGSGSTSSGSSGSTGSGNTPAPAVSYTVIFWDGETEVSRQTVTSGEKAAALETNPEKEGHAFTGWYTSNETQDESTLFDFESTITVDTNLYAGWVKSYNVKFMNGETEFSVQKVNHGGKATAPEAPEAAEGYEFIDWYTVENPTDTDVAYNFDTEVLEDTTLYAVWKKKSYNVTFWNGDTQVGEPQSVSHGEKAVLPNEEEMQALAAEGYTFTGWYTEKEEQTEDKMFSSESLITADINLYAGWKLKSYNVTFMNGETAFGEPQSVEHGKNATKPENEPVSENNSIFVGWYAEASPVENAEPYDFATEAITGDKTLYAVFKTGTCRVTINGKMSVYADIKAATEVEAVKNAEAGTEIEIKLFADNSMNDSTSISIESKGTITLDLNGHSIKGNCNNARALMTVGTNKDIKGT